MLLTLWCNKLTDGFQTVQLTTKENGWKENLRKENISIFICASFSVRYTCLLSEPEGGTVMFRSNAMKTKPFRGKQS